MWLSVLLLLPTAASLMLLGGTTNTIIQIVAGEEFRGRVISHYTQSFMGMMPWGSLLLGWVATRFGVSRRGDLRRVCRDRFGRARMVQPPRPDNGASIRRRRGVRGSGGFLLPGTPRAALV